MGAALLRALGLCACQKDEESAPVAPSDSIAQSTPAATLVDSAGLASGAVAEMQSASMDQQDTTASLTEAADAAVGIAKEGSK
jgi:hypothetical protein